MNIREVAPGLYIAPQILPDHVPLLAREGIKTIINNRPDGEAVNQPSSAEIAEMAAQHGIDYVHIPVRGKEINPEMVAQFAKAWRDSKGKTLAFCQSGGRSGMLFQLASAA